MAGVDVAVCPPFCTCTTRCEDSLHPPLPPHPTPPFPGAAWRVSLLGSAHPESLGLHTRAYPWRVTVGHSSIADCLFQSLPPPSLLFLFFLLFSFPLSSPPSSPQQWRNGNEAHLKRGTAIQLCGPCRGPVAGQSVTGCQEPEELTPRLNENLGVAPPLPSDTGIMQAGGCRSGRGW